MSKRTAGDVVFQSLAIEKFHGDEVAAFEFVNFIDRADVRMIQGRGRLGFALKAAECLRVLGHLFGQELKGHKATELNVLGLVHDTHPATAEFLHDAVVRNGLAD